MNFFHHQLKKSLRIINEKFFILQKNQINNI